MTPKHQVFKNIFLGVLCLVLMTALGVYAFAAENVVYLADGGSGDGASPSAPLGSMTDAFNALGADGGTIVVSDVYTIETQFVAPAHQGAITITSLYNGVDYAKSDSASLQFKANFYCGGTTAFNHITLCQVASATNATPYYGIFGRAHDLSLGEGIISARAEGCHTYLSVIGGSSAVYTDVRAKIHIQSGTWQRVRGGANRGGSTGYDIALTVDGGNFMEKLILASCAPIGKDADGNLTFPNNSHSGDITAVINGGTFYGGIALTSFLSDTDTYEGDAVITVNGGTIHGMLSVAFDAVGVYNGTYTLTVNGGEFMHLTDLSGSADLAGDMTSSLCYAEDVDLCAAESGEITFTNYLRRNNADPFVFCHDGYYYYTSTGDKTVSLIRAANIADIQTAQAHVILTPVVGENLWSPEIWYFTAEEIGAENAGWYMFVAYDDGTTANQRQYVAKCLDGDDLLGRWGDPVTGEVNVLRKMTFTNGGYNENELCGGTSVIRIGGKTYFTFVSEKGRGTAEFHQTINITKFENPWTVTGTPVEICRPTEPWEMGGYYKSTVEADKWWPQVVEGASAVYAPTGEVYLMYTGSGYWTEDYALGFLRFKGGDPLQADNWEKNTDRVIKDDLWYNEWESRWYYKDLFAGRGTLYHPVFARVARADLHAGTVNGCGHGSYFTDADGQTWVAYHGYIGEDTSSKRFSFVEPMYVTANGVTVGDGSGHPASLTTAYTTAANAMPLVKKIADFDTVVLAADSKPKHVALRFNPIAEATEYALYRDGDLLAIVQDAYYYTDSDAATGKHVYTVEAKNGELVLSAAKAIGTSFAGLQYVDLNQDGKVTVRDVLLLVKAYVGKQYTGVSLLDVLHLLKCL